MLDIVVTHYNEPYEVGEKLFAMINLQRGIDFKDIRVLLIHDGTEPFPEETFAEFRFEVKQIPIQHGGISAARNAGIEHSEADWIMFCDFDDTFASIYSIRDILTILPQSSGKYDVLWLPLVVEDMVDGNDRLYFTPERQIWVFTHGKIYSRQFLIESGIRFNEELIFNEDSEFNAHIIARIPHQRIAKVNPKGLAYVWIRRPSSVTQSGRDSEAVWGHFNRNLMVTEENRVYRGKECYSGMVTRTVWDTWFMLNSSKVSDEYKKKIFEKFVPWFRENGKVFMDVSPEILAQIRELSRHELAEPGEIIRDEPERIYAWLSTLPKGDD